MWYITGRYYFIYGVSSSLWTIFFVYVLFSVKICFFPLFTSFSIAGMTKILMFDLTVALDNATYNYQHENIGYNKYLG
jgi:hypothetical protein